MGIPREKPPRAEMKLQARLNHTAEQIVNMQNEVLIKSLISTLSSVSDIGISLLLSPSLFRTDF
jgi:hypothetical protein